MPLSDYPWLYVISSSISHPFYLDNGSTLASFGLGEQVENAGPHLDTEEITSKLLKLLKDPNTYRDNIAYWQRRSKESIGPKGAASIIQQAAVEQAFQYSQIYASSQQFTVTFNK